jgi:hypothetical protein
MNRCVIVAGAAMLVLAGVASVARASDAVERVDWRSAAKRCRCRFITRTSARRRRIVMAGGDVGWVGL